MTSDDQSNDQGKRDPGGKPAHRVGDLVSGRVPKEELDPETIAQLAAWFGAPAQALEPPARKTAQELAEERDPELRELWERRRRAMAAVDPALVDELGMRSGLAEELIHLPEPLTLPIERPLAKFDLSVWKLRLFDVREWEVPEDLSDCLQERTPQAILRDLHRPVLSWPFFLQPMDIGIDSAGQKASDEVVQIIGTRYQVHMRDYPMASHQVRESLASLRARLAEPWEQAELSEEKRSRSSTARTSDDLRWFGDVGYDPDL